MSAKAAHTGLGVIPHPVSSAIPAVPFSCTAEPLLGRTGEIIVLRVQGEVDLCTLPTLRAALDDCLKARPAHLVVDLARMTFCSAGGLALLTEAGRTAAEKTIGYAVSGVRSQLDRVWMLCWGGDLPARYRSTTAAVTVIRAVG